LTIWAYHGTSPEAAQRIRIRGLIPRKQPRRHRGEMRATDAPAIFFAPTADLARVWGPVVLRFPWPEDAHEDSYSDTTIVDGEVVATGYYTTDPVPRHALQVFADARWRDLDAPRGGRGLGSSTGYAYHATERGNLPSILHNGLLPQELDPEQVEETGFPDGVFFYRDLASTRRFAQRELVDGVVLRFPLPARMVGGYKVGEYITPDAVSPSRIEVLKF
jgi:hypothetical protein